jgi:hypothetical protein
MVTICDHKGKVKKNKEKTMNILIREDSVASHVSFIRNERVILDFHLAEMYQTEIKKFKQAIRRNTERFPLDFMFQLSQEEYEQLRVKFPSLPLGRSERYLPFAFTEQGVAMLSSVLNSDRAIQVNIAIMRAFVQMRRFIESNKDILAKVQELEDTMQECFSKQDDKIKDILDVIKHLICENSKPKPQVGFQT